HNGFQTGVGSVDLSDSYQVGWDVPVNKAPSAYRYSGNGGNGSSTTYQGTGTIYRLARNPSADFDTSSWTKITQNSTVESTNSKNIVFKIKRTSSSSCTATAKIPGFAQEFTADCTRYGYNDNYFVASLSTRAVPAYYYIYDGSLKGNCTIDSDDCYKLQFVKNSEQQNFANWYSFYRNRALSTLSAASVAFYKLSPDVRLSWQAINKCQSFDTNGKTAITNRWGQITGYEDNGCGNNLFAAYTAKQRGQLYSWLQTMPFDGGTPLRASLDRAGKFLQSNKAWQKYPNGTGNTSENIYACRPSYHILMTDGMWNGSVSVPASNFRHDNASFTLPDGTAYSPAAPYKDSTDNNLADLAMHYWATDLNTSLENKVPPFFIGKEKAYWDPRNNPATWQSMTNFIVGLALTSSLDKPNIPWSGSTHAGIGYRNLSSGNATWPVTAASGDNNDNNVYDLWHAAINSRGEFYSADSPEGMVQAFDDILTRIADRKSSAAMPGTSSSLEAEAEGDDERLASYFYQSSFDNTEGWTGDIKMVKKYRKYMLNPETQKFEFVDVVEQGWSAKSMMPSADRRNIMIAGGGASKLKAFSTTNAGEPTEPNSLASYLNIDPESGKKTDTWQQRLEYIRGSKANEGEGAGKLRQRSSILGDFLSSQPVIVSGGRY
ncbi:MAG TPA: pilus assembly protein PilY, partial [Pseudomonadales bacterium]|nr:pilus assembly protein PilY [Pseudomonadales bacterium]